MNFAQVKQVVIPEGNVKRIDINGIKHWPNFIEKIIRGVSPLLLPNTTNNSIDQLIQYGLCEQNGTPTPANPIDIKCNNGVIKVKDRELPYGYRRLLDINFDGDFYYNTEEKLTGNDDVTLTLKNTSTAGQNVFGCYSGTVAGRKNFSFYIYGNGSSSNSYLRYGETLYRPNFGSGERTITFGKNGTTGFERNVSITPEEFETDSVAYIGMLPNSSSPEYTGIIVGSILVSNRLKWIPCKRMADDVIGYYEIYTKKFIEKTGEGIPTTSGYDNTYYDELFVDGTPEILYIGGKNLFSSSYEYGNIDGSGENLGNDQNYVRSVGYIKVKPNTIYYFKSHSPEVYDVHTGSPQFYTLEYNENKNFINNTRINRHAVVTINGGTIITGNNTHYIRLFYYRSEPKFQPTIEQFKLQIEEGSSPTSYKPYIEPQTANVENLFAVEDYKDEQDIITGIITRKVGIKVLNGTEDFIMYSDTYIKSDATNICLVKQDSIAEFSGDVICTHLTAVKGSIWNTLGYPNCITLNLSHQIHLNIDNTLTGVNYGVDDRATALAKVKAWIAAQYEAGTPLIVIYPLATETTEQVTPQPLNTTEPSNTVTVNSDLNNIELSVKYKVSE